MSKSKKKQDLDGVLPAARRIPVLDGKAEALVFPLGVIHLRKFNDKISKALLFIAQNVRFKKDASVDEIGMQIMAEVAPLMLTDLLDLLCDCVRFNPNTVKIDDLPHWDFPKIVEEWIDESFGTPEKRDPWMGAIERTVTRMTGSEFSISEMWSKDSSPGDGASTKSPESAKPESPTEA